MKVLYVIDSLAPGGSERSTIVLAPHLRDLGVESTIVTLRAAEHDLTPEAEAAGTTVLRLESDSFIGRVRELRRLVRSGEFDVVHTALYKADQVGRVAAWGTGVPVVSSFVNTPYDKSRLTDPNVKKWKLRGVQTIDAITGRLMVKQFHAVSEGAKIANARALRIPASRVTVAERGRDATLLGERTDERRQAARAALGLSEDAPVVLNLGRQDYQKAQTVLIAATSILAQSHPDLIVLIAGKDGSASVDVQSALADDSVAAAHVRLLGHRTDIGELLCAADVLVISSHFEGTAGAAVEAMALRTPIVSTDLDGLRGVLEHGRNAVLVPVGDPDQLASGIETVLSDRVLAARIAAEGHSDFTDRFKLGAAAERLSELYESVVKPPR
jgi:glycosyltransferase involved in cell wall biosynthesis